MGIAVFRTVENRRSMIRSTNGGYTTAIDPNGKRIGELEPFTEGFLLAEVPVYNSKNTLYTRFGDWFNSLSIIISILGLCWGLLIKYKPIKRTADLVRLENES